MLPNRYIVELRLQNALQCLRLYLHKGGILKTSAHLQCGDFYCFCSPGISLSIRCQCIKGVAFGLVQNLWVVQMRKCRRFLALPVTAQQGNGRLEIRALDSVLCFGWWRDVLWLENLTSFMTGRQIF